MLRRSDEKAHQKWNARILLEQHTPQAFFLVCESASEDERVELAYEAVAVFCRREQTRELKKLAELDYPYVNREHIIEEIIKALITCNDIHSAIGIATLEGKLSFVCRELAKSNHDTTRYIDRLYDQINDLYQRKETADYFLKYYDPNQETEIWFKWYQRYLDEEEDDCWYSRGQEHFDAYFDLGVRRYPRLLAFLRNPKNIKTISHYCGTIRQLHSSKLLPPEFFEKPSDYYQAVELVCQIPALQSDSLVGHLYYYFILKENKRMLNKLESFLSEKNQWLFTVARLMNEDGDFSILHHFYFYPLDPYHQKISSLIKRAFINLFMRHKKKPDDVVLRIIKENCENFESKMPLRRPPYYYVGSFLWNYGNPIESIIEYCKKKGRFTLALLLNAHLLKEEKLFLDILKDPSIILPEESYLVILDYELKEAICNIKSEAFLSASDKERMHNRYFYRVYHSELLSLIPKRIMDRKAPYLCDRFIQRGSKFDKYKDMESNHPLCDALKKFIEDLSDIQEYTHCLHYLSILIKSEWRTQLIHEPLYNLIDQSDYALALQFVELYDNENDCALFKEFIKNLASHEYINALSSLSQLTDSPKSKKESLAILVWDRYVKTKTPEHYFENPELYLEDIIQLSPIMHVMGIEKRHDQFITFFSSDMPRRIEDLFYSRKGLPGLRDLPWDEYSLLEKEYQQHADHYRSRMIEKFIAFELRNDYPSLCKKLLSQISNYSSFSDRENDRNEYYCSLVIKIIQASSEHHEVFDEIDKYMELKDPPNKIKLQLIGSIRHDDRRQLSFIKLYVSLLNKNNPYFYSQDYSLASQLGFKISPNENGLILSIIPLCYQHSDKRHFEYILLTILVYFSELHTDPHFVYLKQCIIKSVENRNRYSYSSEAGQVLDCIKEYERIGWNNASKEKSDLEKKVAVCIAVMLDDLYQEILHEKNFTATLSPAVLYGKASLILAFIPFFHGEPDNSLIINTLIHFKALHTASCLAKVKNRLIDPLTYSCTLLDHAHQLDKAAWQLLDQEEKSDDRVPPVFIIEIATRLYQHWLAMINTANFTQDAFGKQRMQFFSYIQLSHNHPHQKERAYYLLRMVLTENDSFQLSLKDLVSYLFLYIELNQHSGELTIHGWFQQVLKKWAHENDSLLFELINYHYFSMDKALPLRHSFYQAYCDSLSTVLNPAYTQKLAEFYKKLSNTNLEKNILYRNMVIVELRSILDKAFLDFYTKNYKKPIAHAGKRTDIYFPVVPRNEWDCAERGLDDYFSRKKSKGFKKQCAIFYNFLLKIQPISNPQYTWLEDLYYLANRQKHGEDLELVPCIGDRLIVMNQFFPKVFDGLIYILLKMSHLSVTDRNLSQYQFARFFLIHVAESLPIPNQRPMPAEAVHRKSTREVKEENGNKQVSHRYPVRHSASNTTSLSPHVSFFRAELPSNSPVLVSNKRLPPPVSRIHTDRSSVSSEWTMLQKI